MMRHALRKATQKIRAQIADASSLEPHEGNSHVLDAAALMINNFVNESCQALDSLQQVGAVVRIVQHQEAYVHCDCWSFYQLI